MGVAGAARGRRSRPSRRPPRTRRARRLELRQHTRAAAPPGVGPRAHPGRAAAASGSGCRAYCQAFTRPHALRAHGGQRAGERRPVRAAPRRRTPRAGAAGRPEVRCAGISSPRSVSRRVPELSFSSSTFHEVHAPDRWAGLASGEVTPSAERSRSIAPADGFIRSRSAAFGHPRGRQIADVAVGPAEDHRVRLGPRRAVDPREVEGRAVRAVRRLGVPRDAQTVVEQHDARLVDLARVEELRRSGRGAGRGAGGRRDRHGLAGPRPDGERAPQQRAVPGEVAARGPHGEVGARGRLPGAGPAPSSAAPDPGRPGPPGSARTGAPRRRRAPTRRRADRAAHRTPRRPRWRRARPSCAACAASGRWAGRAVNRGRTRGSRAARTAPRPRRPPRAPRPGRRRPPPSAPSVRPPRTASPGRAGRTRRGPGPESADSRWSRASSSAPPERGKSRGPTPGAAAAAVGTASATPAVSAAGPPPAPYAPPGGVRRRSRGRRRGRRPVCWAGMHRRRHRTSGPGAARAG